MHETDAKVQSLRTGAGSLIKKSQVHRVKPSSGTDLKAAIGPDGFKIGAEIAKATGLGRWVEYLWSNPVTGEIGYKRSWLIRHDGYLFGSGYDIETPTAEAAGE